MTLVFGCCLHACETDYAKLQNYKLQPKYNGFHYVQLHP
jgi:hypothetical protein